MTEEEKDTERTEETDEKEERLKEGNSIEEKRGRMVATAILLAVILAVIAVVVAGIFQLTSGWLIACPRDLPVNDPAPILWKKLETKNLVNQSLGVPADLLEQTRFKGSGTEARKAENDGAGKESGSRTEEKGAR